MASYAQRELARVSIARLAEELAKVAQRAHDKAAGQANREEQARRVRQGVKRTMFGTGWQLGQSGETKPLRRRFEALLVVEQAAVAPELAAIRRKIARIVRFHGFNDIDADGRERR